ncbi:QueT transporter family protein [Haloprofundus halophilus]|uniref:QueT transporter family protein n=1 Tax=Haloprofundus halophilus TaxID=2283527 RepID=UPI0018E5A928|nr:QueT transporter family protein [Haloprofundus halophilus]
MDDIIEMWKDVRMVMLTVVVAAVYAAALIPSQGFVIVPHLTTVRPGNVFPVVFSLLFGPAAAWGSAFGNLFSDAFSGTLTWGSAFGFVGNFFYGFVAYRLWGNLGQLSSGEEPTMRSGGQLVEFLLIAFAASALTAAIIAWGVDLLGLVPFSVLAVIITLNNFVAVALLGPPLLYLLYPRVKEAGLLYTDLLARDDPRVVSRRQRTAAMGLAAVAVGWTVTGVAVGIFVEGVPFGTMLGSEAAVGGSTLEAALGGVSFVLALGFAVLTVERLSALGGNREGAPVEELVEAPRDDVTLDAFDDAVGEVVDESADEPSDGA